MQERDGCYETLRSSLIKMTGWFFCTTRQKTRSPRKVGAQGAAPWGFGHHSTRGFIPTRGGGTFEKSTKSLCWKSHHYRSKSALLGNEQYQCCKTLIMEHFSIFKIVYLVWDFTFFESMVAGNDPIIFWKQNCSILMSHLSCRRASITYSDWGPAGSPASACGPSVLQSWWRAVCLYAWIRFPLKTGHFPLCDPWCSPNGSSFTEHSLVFMDCPEYNPIW